MCSICGSNKYSEGVVCHKSGKTVCKKCCDSCEHRGHGDIRCSYGYDYTEKMKKRFSEIAIQIYQIEIKKKNTRSSGKRMERLAWEEIFLKREQRKLQSEYENFLIRDGRDREEARNSFKLRFARNYLD